MGVSWSGERERGGDRVCVTCKVREDREVKGEIEEYRGLSASQIPG